jgi:hypothetical protein
MIIYVTRKKASNHKDLAKEKIEIPKPETVEELLIYLTTFEYNKQYDVNEIVRLEKKEIDNQATLGRVSFGRVHNEAQDSLKKAIEIMAQDFIDQLFRVYINKKEYMTLEEKVEVNEYDEVTIIRFVMLAGRLW